MTSSLRFARNRFNSALSAMAATLLLLISGPALAQVRSAPPSPPLPFELDAELQKANFSGTLLVKRNGRPVAERSFGLADRGFGVSITAQTRFRVASITKLFTSVMVLQLVEQGKIELDAPFRSYLPDYPGPGAEAITVRQLLGHMSGLPQFDTVASFDVAIAEGIPQYQKPRTPKQLYEMCCSAAPVARPGERFDYNNADYIVLGQLIEAVTGETYTAALDRLLLRPLGLKDTGMPHWSQIVPALARTYFRRPGGTVFENELPFFWENSYAAGGLYSTRADIARFSDALFGGQILSAKSMRELLKPAGDEYGLGLWSYDFTRKGVRYRVAKRPGSIMGANAMLYRLPDNGLSIVILANTNAVDLDGLAQRLAQAVIDGRAIR
jgi:D-alanyl-D-alanine carboxypeptidase